MCDPDTLKHFAAQDKVLNAHSKDLQKVHQQLVEIRSVQASISEDVNATAKDAREKIANLNAKMDSVVGDITSIKVEQAKPLLTIWQKLVLVSCIPAALFPVYDTMFTAKQLHDAFSTHVEKDMSEHQINAKNIHALDNRIIVLEQK